MGKTLVTGGSGFIGSHVVRKLIKRGDEVKLTVRKNSSLENLEGLKFAKVSADILDRRSLRRAMKDVDKVFHIAGAVDFRIGPERLFEINVVGTRNVLTEALRAGVERVVYTSSVVAIGPAKRRSSVDETNLYTIGKLGLAYANSKREAEIEALRIAARGLPLVIVNPAFVLGAGDIYNSSTFVVRRFLKRQIPMYVDGGLNIVDVDDVATGHLLADRKGKVGERYILGNQNYSHDRFFAELSRLSGVGPPAIKLPNELALRFAQVAQFLSAGAATSPELVKSAGLWWTFKIAKAKRELGYSPGHPDETMQATIDWYLEREGDRLGRGREQPLPLRVFGRTLQLNRRLLRQAMSLTGEKK